MPRKAAAPQTSPKTKTARSSKVIPESAPDLQARIHHIRGLHVMLDRDLAKLYHVEIKALNQAVKRNAERFPTEFCFKLSAEEAQPLRSQSVIVDCNPREWASLRSQFATLDESYQEPNSLRSQTVTLEKGRGRYSKFLPYAFTEQGVAMLSAVLRSETAVRVSIRIMQAFVDMRRVLHANTSMLHRIDTVEKRQVGFEVGITHKFDQVFNALEKANQTTHEYPKEGIFYEGQIHDAHAFVSGLIRGAKSSIVLIDNYIDETVLTLLAKRQSGVSAVVCTRKISESLRLDLAKHNAQYPAVDVREFAEAHDRFLILDETTLYHFGASLKDLGKKWFAFSRFEQGAESMLGRLGISLKV